MSDQIAPPPLDVLLARREWVRRFARTLAKDDASADDLEQDAWLAALEHPPRNVDAPAGWLRRVLVRRAIDVGVEGKRREARENAAARPEATPASADVVAAAESHRRVVEAVLALDEPYRTTVLLRFFEDLPPRAVAARMNVPVETVRARVRRACERLRARLDDEHRGERAAWLAPLLAARSVADAATAGKSPGGVVAGSGKSIAVYAACAAVVVVGAWTLLAWIRASDGDAVRETASVRRDASAPSRRAPRRRVDVAPPAAAPQPVDEKDAAAPPVVDPKAPREFVVSVVDGHGAAVSGVRVRIDPAEMEKELDAVSDARGRAQFEVVGAVRSARAEPHASDGRAWRPTRRVVAVPAGATRVECVVEPGAWIRGRVEHADGNPFEWAEVVAVSNSRRVANAYADEHGAFEIAVPETGPFDVAVTGRSHQVFGTTNGPTGRVTNVMDRGFGPTDGEIDGVATGTDGIVLVARKPAEKRAMRVRTVAADGRPVAGVAVRVDDGKREFANKPKPLATTAADGRCTVDDVPECRVAVSVANGPDDPRPWIAAGCMPPVVPLLARPGEAEVVVEFQPASTIVGRVETPADMKRRLIDGRAQSVQVQVRFDDEFVGVAWTDADDRFVASAPASSSGRFRVSASIWAEDGRRYDAQADDVAAGAENLVLRLTTNDPPSKPSAAPAVVAPK